jgi:hypothetical protein
MQVTNDKIGQLEAMQIATNTKLMGLETAVGNIDKSLAALLRCFDELHAKTNEQHDDWGFNILLILNKMNKTLAIADG